MKIDEFYFELLVKKHFEVDQIEDGLLRRWMREDLVEQGLPVPINDDYIGLSEESYNYIYGSERELQKLENQRVNRPLVAY